MANSTTTTTEIDTTTSLLAVLLANQQRLAYNMDILFVTTFSMIIFLMQAGFAFLEAGCVRSKNTTNILLKNLLDSSIAAISYWAIGYAFSYGEGNLFIGYSSFFGTYPEEEMSKWFFEMVFCATASSIISGAVAERCHLVSYFAYSFFLSAFCYPVVTRWTWHITTKPGDHSGWLTDGFSVAEGITFQDFAGSGVVHGCGGMAALVGALFLGPRIGFLDDSGKPQAISGHSVPLAALGGLILMFGFCAFNGGSQFTISGTGDGDAVARAIVNTLVSGSGAGLTVLILHRIFVSRKNFFLLHGNWSLLKTLNGILGGMVAICAGANVAHTWGAFVTGIVAGVCYYFGSVLIPKLKIDDPLEAVAVHLCCGTWGLIAAPLFDSKIGILATGSRASFMRLGLNVLGWLAIMTWTATLCSALFAVLKAAKILRVPAEAEIKGLDFYLHSEPSYPEEAYGHGWYDDEPRNIVADSYTRNNLSTNTLPEASPEDVDVRDDSDVQPIVF